MSADRTTITSGESTIVRWVSSNGAWVHGTTGGLYCSNNPSGDCLNGYNTVSPTQTTNYWLTIECKCSSGQNCGSKTANVTVNVNPAPAPEPTPTPTPTPPAPLPDSTITLIANPSMISSGQTSIISWVSTNASRVQAQGPEFTIPTPCPNLPGGWCWGQEMSLSGSYVVTPSQTSAYEVCARGAYNHTACASSTITVTSPTPAPTVDLSFNPTSIIKNSSGKLSWSSSNASSLQLGISDKCGAVPALQPWDISIPTGNTDVKGDCAGSITYYINASGAGGMVSKYATLTVTDQSLSTEPTPTPNPTPTNQSGCENIAAEGIIKLDQTRGQYYLIKDDKTTIYLENDPEIIINFKDYLDHKVKLEGCASGINIKVRNVILLDSTSVSSLANQVSAAKPNPLAKLTTLIATGGSLGINILIAIIISAIITYLMLRKKNI